MVEKEVPRSHPSVVTATMNKSVLTLYSIILLHPHPHLRLHLHLHPPVHGQSTVCTPSEFESFGDEGIWWKISTSITSGQQRQIALLLGTTRPYAAYSQIQLETKIRTR